MRSKSQIRTSLERMHREEKKARVPFFVPSIGAEEIHEVCKCLSNKWITSGEVTSEFEELFAQKIDHGVSAVAVNSATAGMHLALEALGISAGDEVLLPVNTFTATAEVICYLGATPKFVDIDYETMNIDCEQIERKITPNTKAIMPVHIAGRPVDMTRLIEISRKYNLKVVEDAAHAFPSTYQGRPIGALESDATVFSFYATKTITTGEGGMIVTRNQDVANRCRLMRLHGINHAAFERRYKSSDTWRYDVVAPGYKYNMTDISASIGIQQLKKSQELNRKRAQLAQLYKELLDDLPLDLPINDAPGDESSWHLFVVRLQLDEQKKRDELIARLAEDGVNCSVHFIPLYKMTHWRESLSLQAREFPRSNRNFKNCLSLPLFPDMTREHIDIVVNSLKMHLT